MVNKVIEVSIWLDAVYLDAGGLHRILKRSPSILTFHTSRVYQKRNLRFCAGQAVFTVVGADDSITIWVIIVTQKYEITPSDPRTRKTETKATGYPKTRLEPGDSSRPTHNHLDRIGCDIHLVIMCTLRE